jgi:hypothetical protein
MIIQTLTKSVATAATLLVLSFGVPAMYAGGAPDLDGDGIPNIVDPDIDNDGIPNALDDNVDGGVCKYGPFAGKYLGDHVNNDSPAEKDMDDDGQDDDSLAERDVDGDGKSDDDALELDIDGDRRLDNSAAEMDTDGDGSKDDDLSEDDIDGDSLSDDDDSEMDIDGDGTSDGSDGDIDGDNKGNSSSVDDDIDGDGKLNVSTDEDDDDGDGMKDRDDEDDDNDGDDDNNDSDHHEEDDEQEVQITLTKSANAPSGCFARVKIQRMATGKIEMFVSGRAFPAGAYDVTVDGTLIGQLNMIQDGSDLEGEQEWETNANRPDEINLTIEVIGKPIVISRNGLTYFTGTVPTPPTSTGGGTTTTSSQMRLVRGPAASGEAHGKIEVEWNLTGAKELDLEIESIPAGSYSFIVDGTVRGTIIVSGYEGALRFDVSPRLSEGELALDFAISGLPVVIAQGVNVFFTGTLPSAPGDAGGGTGGDNGGGAPIVSALNPTANAPLTAKGAVQVQFGIAGVVSMEVEVEHLVSGTYTLNVGDAARGIILVVAGEGKIRFEITPNDPSELLLDFAVAGLPVSLTQGDVVFFTGTAPVAPAAS